MRYIFGFVILLLLYTILNKISIMHADLIITKNYLSCLETATSEIKCEDFSKAEDYERAIKRKERFYTFQEKQQKFITGK